MLLNFNNLSSARLQQMSERFLHHTRTLVEMKRDLDSIFRRIRWVLGPPVSASCSEPRVPPLFNEGHPPHVAGRWGDSACFTRLHCTFSIGEDLKILEFLNLNFIPFLKMQHSARPIMQKAGRSRQGKASLVSPLASTQDLSQEENEIARFCGSFSSWFP